MLVSNHKGGQLLFSLLPKIDQNPGGGFGIFGSKWAILGVWVTFKNCIGVYGVVEQLSFSMIPLILTFEFDLILGSFFYFWDSNGLFLGLEMGSKTVLGSTHVVEQLSFSMFPSILTFDFDLILRSF